MKLFSLLIPLFLIVIQTNSQLIKDFFTKKLKWSKQSNLMNYVSLKNEDIFRFRVTLK